ncbi:uncharacterized protein LOC116167015 [Photinus pyralis]|uniref:uncharacterized protein LOC116167015 n=1 Tax=Photinus pyralis TaxID=7054 RepID=UPI00126705CC|nr:uncharacterized protein LOC116167015 [Photinus pyralis]
MAGSSFDYEQYSWSYMRLEGTWQDLKSRAKIKASTNKRYARGTGGGPPQEDPLTKTEEDIMEIIKEVCAEGHKETNESEVKFNFNSIMNNDIDFIPDENIQEIPVVISSSCNNVDTIKNIVEPIAPSTPGNDITKGVCTPRVPKNKQLHHTLQALNSFQQNLDTQSSIQKQYYEEKIKVLTRIAVAKEKAVEVKNRIVVALEAIADSIS